MWLFLRHTTRQCRCACSVLLLRINMNRSGKILECAAVSRAPPSDRFQITQGTGVAPAPQTIDAALREVRRAKFRIPRSPLKMAPPVAVLLGYTHQENLNRIADIPKRTATQAGMEHARVTRGFSHYGQT